MQQAVIVDCFRTAVGKAPKGTLRNTRPDDMAAAVIRALLEKYPNVPQEDIDDVILGCAMPEGEQGMNMARIAALRAGLSDQVPGVTINRFCSSGLQSIAMAADRIRGGSAQIILAGGAESMSMIPMSGNKFAPNPWMVDHLPEIYIGMGLTAENVVRKYHVSREDADQFAYNSHQKALAAQAAGKFDDEIVPLEVEYTALNGDGKPSTKKFTFNKDEGPRADTSVEALAKLRPVFHVQGSVTAGNSSQTSDGAAMAGLSVQDIDLIELNEAFAAQALAVIRQAGLDIDRINVNGGAVALGHPLGCTGAKLTATILREMDRRKSKYGMVTMCIGGGQGAAGIFERM